MEQNPILHAAEQMAEAQALMNRAAKTAEETKSLFLECETTLRSIRHWLPTIKPR